MRATIKLTGAAVVGAILLAGASAQAASCTVNATAVSFGTYDPTSGGPLDTTGTVSVTCSSSAVPEQVRYEIRFSTGQIGSYNPRAMTNGTSQLNYNLYEDAARSSVLGDGTGSTEVITEKYNLTPPNPSRTISYTAYGRTFAGQNVSVGSYQDTITATVVF